MRRITRYSHATPRIDSKLYAQGKKQAEINLERFHYLRASILGTYRLIDNIPPDRSRGQLFPRQGISFEAYGDYKLDPITGEKLHVREDGTVHPGDLEQYHQGFVDNWKTMEGGILYCIGDARAFFNIILNYHSAAKTTGSTEWDVYFAKLKETGFPKCLIPCMFFAREAGCLDGDCPFEHDEVAKRGDREKVLDARRRYMKTGTPKKVSQHQMRLTDQYREAHGFEADDYLPDEAYVTPPESLYCANPACDFTWIIPADGDLSTRPLKLCSGCKWAYYCSRECQKSDWTRHKREPCKSLEAMIEDDDLWSPIGTRKGTEIVNIDWGNA